MSQFDTNLDSRLRYNQSQALFHFSFSLSALMSIMLGPPVGVERPSMAIPGWFCKVQASPCDANPFCIVPTPIMKSTRRDLCRGPPPWLVKSGKYKINGTIDNLTSFF